MNRQQFEIGIDQLKDTYSDRAYPDPRVRRLWEWACRMDAKLFALTIEDAIGSCAQAPMLPKLREIYGEIRAKNPTLVTKIPCDFCDGCGIIVDDSLPGNAYACKCETGNDRARNTKRWTGPWVRIVPRPHELMQAKPKELISKTFNKMDGNKS